MSKPTIAAKQPSAVQVTAGGTYYLVQLRPIEEAAFLRRRIWTPPCVQASFCR